MIDRPRPGESKEAFARRVYEQYQLQTDSLWNDTVGELAGILGITEKEAEELLGG